MSIRPALAACAFPLFALGLASCTQPVQETTAIHDIQAVDIVARVQELADDKYQGRGPGTEAGEAAAQWIADEMKRIGLAPGNGDSYFQTVEMVAQTVNEATSSLTIQSGNKSFELKMGDDAVYTTKHQDQPTVSINNSELVFVGYGVNAPELGWNDYEGIDVKGKTVVMFVNDPGFITHDDSLFNGKAMTYYGRWTYKYEEASRQGAAAALLIHEDEPAAYGWDVVNNSWRGEQADLVYSDAGASRTLLDGWIKLGVATQLFEAAGLDIDALRAAANKPGFEAVPITGLKATATINQTIEKRQSRNVVGTVIGTDRPDEHMLYTAHWDHLGMKTGGAEGEDVIYNGAIDNATGVALMLSIAEKFASGPAPERSVTFLAVTLEESGLLGSAYFADHPFIPLNKIIAGVNMDAILPTGRTRDMVVVGYGASQLEDILTDILAGQNRIVTPDPEPEAGYFYRSDHISLSKKGVPMLYADGGVDAIEGGEERGRAIADSYRANDYHNYSDEYSPDWDMSGMVEDANVYFELGRRIATSTDWPSWYPGNEFEAIRKASLSGE